MNSASTNTTAVVISVCVASTNMGWVASCHPETPNSHSLMSAPDSMPQMTKAKLLPSSMDAMNN